MPIKVYDLNAIKAEKILGGPIKPVLANGKRGTKSTLVAFGVFKPGDGLYPHFHPKSEEVYYVVQGQGTVFIGRDKKPVPIRAGQVLYVPSKTRHGITNSGDEELVVAFIMAPGVKSPGYEISKDTKVTEERVLS